MEFYHNQCINLFDFEDHQLLIDEHRKLAEHNTFHLLTHYVYMWVSIRRRHNWLLHADHQILRGKNQGKNQIDYDHNYKILLYYVDPIRLDDHLRHLQYL